MQYGGINMRIKPGGNFGNVKKNLKSKMNVMKKKSVPKFGFGRRGYGKRSG